MTEREGADLRRITNLIYEMQQSNRIIAELITHLWSETALPEAIALQLLNQLQLSAKRLNQLKPRS